MTASRSRLQVVACIVVSALLVSTGVMKIFDPGAGRAGDNVASILGGPWLLIAVGAIEVAVGAILLTRYWAPAAWAALLLLVAFLGTIFVFRVLGIPVESCGCFGNTARVSFAVHMVMLLAGVVACCLAVRTPSSTSVSP